MLQNDRHAADVDQKLAKRVCDTSADPQGDRGKLTTVARCAAEGCRTEWVHSLLTSCTYTNRCGGSTTLSV